MNELWVARDGIGTLMTNRQPSQTRSGTYYVPGGDPESVAIIPASWFPELRLGECKRLVMAEESSE